MQKKTRVWLLLVIPGVFFVVFFMLIPLFSLCFSSFYDDAGFTLANYSGSSATCTSSRCSCAACA